MNLSEMSEDELLVEQEKCLYAPNDGDMGNNIKRMNAILDEVLRRLDDRDAEFSQ